MPRCHYRPAVDCERDLTAYRLQHPETFAAPEAPVDLSRGHIRFAAEAMLAAINGDGIPEEAMMRALAIAETMARG